MSNGIHIGPVSKKVFRALVVCLSLIAAGEPGPARAQTFTNLWFFTGGADGRGPHSLLQAHDGNLYGTTGKGGNTSLNGGMGWSTAFRIAPGGGLTNLHSFVLTDGAYVNELVQGSDSNFW